METTLLETLIQNGESSEVEFKLAPPRPAELAERLAGMANATGGYIIFGVADQTWEVVGLKDPAGAIDLILKAARLCTPTLPLEPARPQISELYGKKLVVAFVPPSTGPIYQASGTFWIRRGTHTVPLELDEIREMLYRGGMLDWETRPVDNATLADLDMQLVETFLERRAGRSKSAGRFDDLTELLLKTRCATQTEDASGQKVIRPTGAGLLLFGHNPQDFILHAEVVCVLYPDEVGLRRYLDRRNLRGPITAQIDQAEAFLRQYTAVGARIEGFHRIDEPEYALEALREAVVNAVVHRDYSLRGEKVRIFYYPDRIEIHSPGLLMPGISLSELSQGKTRSKPRNNIIANLLPEFPGGYMEQLGTGISFMINQSRSLGRPAPEFKEQGEFIVTFWRQATNQVAQVPTRPKPLVALETVELPQTAVENLSQLRRQELALRYVQKYGAITNSEYRTVVKVSEATARRDLELLVEQGSLRAVGSKRARKYLLE